MRRPRIHRALAACAILWVGCGGDDRDADLVAQAESDLGCRPVAVASRTQRASTTQRCADARYVVEGCGYFAEYVCKSHRDVLLNSADCDYRCTIGERRIAPGQTSLGSY